MTDRHTRTRPGRRARLLAAGLVTGGAALLLGAAPAFAHVEAEGAPAADGATSVTFSFQHGCEQGSQPTTSLRVQLPAGTTAVQATAANGFTVDATDSEIDWTGGSVAFDTPAEFTATMKLTGNAGDTVFFPTIQGCAGGAEEAWIDKSTDPEAPTAAPRIVLGTTSSTTEGGDHDHDAGSTTTASSAASTTSTAKATTTSTGASTTSSAAAASTTTAAPATTSTSSSGPSAGLIAAIIAAIVVVVGLVLWLVRRNQGGAPEDPAADAGTGA